MTNLIRVRALQRRPLRLAGNIISTSGDGSVLDLDAPRVAQDIRNYTSYPFRNARFIVTGGDTAGTDAGAHSFPPNKAKDELTYVKGQILWQAIELGAGETISSVTLYSGATALNTGTHQYVGLYSMNAAGTLLTQVAVTADGTSGAWAASTAKTFTFSTAYKTVAGGVYYVAFIMTGTTAPTLVGRSSQSALMKNYDGPASGLYEYETLLAGNNNDLRFYGGSAATIVYVDPAGNDQLLAVTVLASAITVSLATGGGGAITSTAALVLAAINASAPAAALLTAVLKPGNDGTGVVTAMAIQTLAAQTLPSTAVNGDAQIALPTTLSTGALQASNLEPIFTLA